MSHQERSKSRHSIYLCWSGSYLQWIKLMSQLQPCMSAYEILPAARPTAGFLQGISSLGGEGPAAKSAKHVRVARALLEKRQSWESGAALNRWNRKAIDCMLNQSRVIFQYISYISTVSCMVADLGLGKVKAWKWTWKEFGQTGFVKEDTILSSTCDATATRTTREFSLHGPIHPTLLPNNQLTTDWIYPPTPKKNARGINESPALSTPGQHMCFGDFGGFRWKNSARCSAAIQAAIKEYVKHKAVPREIRTFISQTPVLKLQSWLKDAGHSRKRPLVIDPAQLSLM